MENDNKKINELLWQRTVLIRQEDRHEITKEEFDEKMKIVMNELNPLQKELVQSMIEKNVEKNKEMEEKYMAEEKVVKEKKAKVASERKPREVKKFSEKTKASLVAKALQMKSVKNVDKAVEQVKSWNPEFDEKNLKSYVAGIITATKNQRGRWALYTWDEENFTLIPKTPKV